MAPSTDGWTPHPQAAPDGAAAEQVLATVRSCANSWAPAARVLGNVRAGDLVRALDEVRERLTGPAMAPASGAVAGEWGAAGLLDLAQRLESLKTRQQDDLGSEENVRTVADAHRLIEAMAVQAAARPYEDILPETAGRSAPRL